MHVGHTLANHTNLQEYYLGTFNNNCGINFIPLVWGCEFATRCQMQIKFKIASQKCFDGLTGFQFLRPVVEIWHKLKTVRSEGGVPVSPAWGWCIVISHHGSNVSASTSGLQVCTALSWGIPQVPPFTVTVPQIKIRDNGPIWPYGFPGMFIHWLFPRHRYNRSKNILAHRCIRS